MCARRGGRGRGRGEGGCEGDKWRGYGRVGIGLVLDRGLGQMFGTGFVLDLGLVHGLDLRVGIGRLLDLDRGREVWIALLLEIWSVCLLFEGRCNYDMPTVIPELALSRYETPCVDECRILIAGVSFLDSRKQLVLLGIMCKERATMVEPNMESAYRLCQQTLSQSPGSSAGYLCSLGIYFHIFVRFKMRICPFCRIEECPMMTSSAVKNL